MLNQYHVTPAANTETDLIPAVGTGKAVVIEAVEIIVTTTAEVELNIYDATPAKIATIPLSITGPDVVPYKLKRFIPAGAKIMVKSDQEDTTFLCSGVETANA